MRGDGEDRIENEDEVEEGEGEKQGRESAQGFSAGEEEEDRVFVGRRELQLDLDREDPEGVLLPGLGTMMSDAVDWSSEERREGFQRWKRDLLRRVERIEAAS
jgi:hypothetical protein